MENVTFYLRREINPGSKNVYSPFLPTAETDVTQLPDLWLRDDFIIQFQGYLRKYHRKHFSLDGISDILAFSVEFF